MACLACNSVHSVRGNAKQYYVSRHNSSHFTDDSSQLRKSKDKIQNDNSDDVFKNTFIAESDVSTHTDLYNTKSISIPSNDIGLRTSSDEERTNNRLPTIREQMKKITDEQSAIKTGIANVKSDIVIIKSQLDEIVEALNLMRTGKSPVALKGDESINSENPEIILSDEAAKNTESKSDSDLQPVSDSKVPKAKKFNFNSKNKYPLKSKNVTKQEPGNENGKSDSDWQSGSDYMPDYMQSALKSFSKKNYIAAITDLNKVVKGEHNPKVLSNSIYLIGESYFGLQKYNDAIQNFREVIKMPAGEKKLEAQMMLAESYNKIGEKGKAKDVYKKIVDNYPQSEYLPHALKMLQIL